MKLRILTNENYIDVQPKNLTRQQLMEALDTGGSVAMDTVDGSIFILNTLNVMGIYIINDEDIPPIPGKGTVI